MKNLFVNRLFLAGLLLKILCLFFFPSHFPRDLFLPFLDNSLLNWGSNPWVLTPNSFPYGGFLFALLLIPKALIYAIFQSAALGTGPISLFALKLPLLAFDILLLYWLCAYKPQQQIRLIWYYWLNPILFFISYVHGQLDVVSMALVFGSIFYLTRERIWISLVLFVLSALCKLHVLIILPFILVYIWNRDFRKAALKKMTVWMSISTIGVLIGYLPQILSFNSSMSPISQEVSRLLAFRLDLDSHFSFFIGLALTLLCVTRLLLSTRISKQGLIYGSGALFIALVAFTSPATGWLFWCIPFLSLFFSTHRNFPSISFWALNLIFIWTFIVLPELNFSGESEALINGLSFTLFNTILFFNGVVYWILGTQSHLPISRRTSPVSIGLAGDSGSGKNYLTDSLLSLFGKSSVSVLEGDNYHKWERHHEKWEAYTHLNPKANHLYSLSKHCKEIRSGKTIFHKHYDHKSGKFSDDMALNPSKTLIVQGLHTFFLGDMREQFDLKIFLNPDPLVRKALKIHRDCLQRGYNKERVLKQLEDRESDSHLFIQRQIEFADLQIRYYPIGNFSATQADAGEIPNLGVIYSVRNSTDLSPILDLCLQMKMKASLEIHRDLLDFVHLRIEGEPPLEQIQKMASDLFSNIRQLTRGREEPIWQSGLNGLTQLIVLWVIALHLGIEDA